MRRTLSHGGRLATLAILAAAVLGGCLTTSAAQGEPELRATLDDIRQSNASAWGTEVPGLGAAVIAEGDIVSALSGSADPPASTPLSPPDRFHVGSLTKTFTAALIMVLDQEGKLSLNDPISRWLDYPGGDDITIRMLLGHTSGIPDFTSAAGLTREESPREAVALAAEMAPLFAPDASWAYSNTNYMMLGLISELAAGDAWGHEGSINGFVANAAYLVDSEMAIAVTSNFAMTDSFAALGEVATRMARP